MATGHATESDESDMNEVELKDDQDTPPETLHPEKITSEIEKLNKLGNDLCQLRQRPLLLLYYSHTNCGEITETDITYLEEILKPIDAGIQELDVLIQTRGGEVSSSYFIAQLIRSKCKKMYTIIPTFSYSGGTGISLASDHIELHTTSKISPIDVQLTSIDEKNMFPLLNLDGFIDFVHETTKIFQLKDEQNRSEIIARLMIEFCKNVHPFQLGQLFRLRELHAVYARELLLNYMFRNDSHKESRTKYVIDKLTSGSPAHEFNIDIALARKYGLVVKEMEQNVYLIGKKIINLCEEMENTGIIADFYDGSHTKRSPYFQLFIHIPSNKSIGGKYGRER